MHVDTEISEGRIPVSDSSRLPRRKKISQRRHARTLISVTRTEDGLTFLIKQYNVKIPLRDGRLYLKGTQTFPIPAKPDDGSLHRPSHTK